MDVQVRDIIQNELNSYCPGRTGSESRNGFYAGTEPPMTTVEFRAHLEASTESFKADSWDLASIDKYWAIEDGMLAYINTYAGWVNGPLIGEATQALKDWQAQARRDGV